MLLCAAAEVACYGPDRPLTDPSSHVAAQSVDRALIPERERVVADLRHQCGLCGRRGVFRYPKRNAHQTAAPIVHDAGPVQPRLFTGDSAVTLHRVEHRFPVLGLR